uniref:NTF2-like domain-containing protein n=1 Tax=Davidia involucrata TaxID=16924 RepID=A0A5B6ZH83_DAVIN
MAFLLPNLSPTLLLQSKDRPVIHHTPLSPTIHTAILSPLTKLEPPLLRVAQVNQTPGSQDNQQRNDFYLNLGLSVRTLREDLPSLFTKDLNYDIYRDDITFVDPLNTFTGIENYKLIFWALRFHGKILFREISLEVFRVWQPSENVILIRWNLMGVPRVPWEAKGEFQGTSRYKLDRNGKIYEHRVDNLALNFPQPLKPAASVLDLVAPCPASPNPTFLLGPPSCSWVEFYRAVRETLDHEGYLIAQDCLATCS